MYSIQNNHSQASPSLRVTHRSRILDMEHQIRELRSQVERIQQMELDRSEEWIEFSTRREHYALKATEIKYCQANDNYTRVFLTDGRNIFLSQSLKSVENRIDNKDFIRCHQSYLVNIDAVSRMKSKGECYLILETGEKIPVSRRRKREVLLEIRRVKEIPSESMARNMSTVK